MTENAIVIERHIPHPNTEVWAALTTPELLARWWAPGDIAPTVGYRFAMDPRRCAAIVDRLTFNGAIIETGTDSYRLAHTKQHLP